MISYASSRRPPNTICATLSQILGGIALLGMLSSAIAVAPLSVSGNKILASGKPASLSGNSLFWSNVNWGGERFYNANTVSWLKNDWKSTIVRAAMGVEEGGGFLQDPAFNKAKVKAVVDAAIANDMYVIIDWHSHKAQDYRSAAIAFFEEMARTYGHHPNIIYEIYNEPLQVSWSSVIKPYAEAVAGAIRAIDPDNLIVVGTPNWSQNVDEASLDPITRYPNIAYTLHFYSGSHQQLLRDKAQIALNRNIALFVTEWGSVNADGNGGVNVGETWAWVDFMKRNHISNANWALNDKAEGASALVAGASTTGGWGDGQLTTSGKLAREITRGWPVETGPTNPPPTPPTPTPATPGYCNW
jgi:aryl-phospho-beta-D-glucosidase BglC (GH1 family)